MDYDFWLLRDLPDDDVPELPESYEDWKDRRELQDFEKCRDCFTGSISGPNGTRS